MRRRGGIIIAVIAVVVVVGGAAVAWWAATRPPDARATAAAYLDALAAQDGAAATALLADASDADRMTAAFASASAYPSAPTVREVDEHGSTATARVAFRLAGTPRTATIELTRVGDRWRLGSTAVGSLVASTSLGDTVTLGEARLRAGSAVVLLPAVYTIAAAPARVLSGTAVAAVVPGASSDAAVMAALSPEAATTASTQLEPYEDACTATAAAVPGHCGLRVPWAADLATLKSIAYRVDKRPALTIAADGTSFAATGGVVVATATGTTRAGQTGRFTYRAGDWALRGSVSFAGGTMTLSID